MLGVSSLDLTPQQKMAKLIDLASIIEINKDPKTQEIPNHVKQFSLGALMVIDECEESWCDNCPVRNQIGMLCSEWIGNESL